MNSICATSDGGYILIGNTSSLDGDVNTSDTIKTPLSCWIVKIDNYGKIEWQKVYGGSGFDDGRKIIQTKDGGYIFIGATSSRNGDVNDLHYDTSQVLGNDRDCWVVKINSVGEILWSKCFGGFLADYGNTIIENTKGGYILGSNSASNDGDVSGHHHVQNPAPPFYLETYDIWIVSIDENGKILWQNSIGGTNDDVVRSIKTTPDGGYILCGTTTSNDGDVVGYHLSTYARDGWVVKLNSYGKIEWQKTIGGTGDDELSDIILYDKDYLTVGTVESSDGDLKGIRDTTNNPQYNDAILARIDQSGKLISVSTFGDQCIDDIRSIKVDNSGLILTGVSCSYDSTGKYDSLIPYYSNDYWILQLDKNLKQLSNRVFGGSDMDEGIETIKNSDGTYTIAGIASSEDRDIKGHHLKIDSSGKYSNYDYWMLNISMPQVGIDDKNDIKSIDLYPNPADLFLNINAINRNSIFTISDGLGRLNKKGILSQGENRIDLSDLPPTFYIISVYDNDGNCVKRKFIRQLSD